MYRKKCEDCQNEWVTKNKTEKCSKCGSEKVSIIDEIDSYLQTR
ncbi:hypothetical protein ACFL08_04670 [Patescibacteria group bacterium]